jgi:hypothetical protein
MSFLNVINVINDIRQGETVEDLAIKYNAPAVYIRTLVCAYNDLCPDTKVYPPDYFIALSKHRVARKTVGKDERWGKTSKRVLSAVETFESASEDLRYRVRVILEIISASPNIPRTDIANLTGLNLQLIGRCFDIIDGIYKETASYETIKIVPISTPLIPLQRLTIHHSKGRGEKYLEGYKDIDIIQ